jgi:hypothetical protein
LSDLHTEERRRRDPDNRERHALDHRGIHTSRARSPASAVLLNARRVAKAASVGSTSRASISRCVIARWKAISSASSSSSRRRRIP